MSQLEEQTTAREQWRKLDEHIVPAGMLRGASEPIIRRFRDSTVACQIGEKPPPMRLRGGLEVLALVEFTNAFDKEHRIVASRKNVANGLQVPIHVVDTTVTPKPGPLLQGGPSQQFARRFVVETPVEVEVKPPPLIKPTTEEATCQTDHPPPQVSETAERVHTTIKKSVTERLETSQRKPSADYELIHPNNQEYENIGEQSPLKQVEFLRGKLQETETRLAEQNAYLREHIAMLHRQMYELKEDADYFEEELQKSQKEREELTSTLKQYQPRKTVHVGVDAGPLEVFCAKESMADGSTNQRPASPTLANNYKSVLELNTDLSKRIAQLRLTNEALSTNQLDKDQELLTHREAIDTLNYNLSSHRREISELTAFLNEQKLRAEKLIDRNCQLTEANDALKLKYEIALRQRQQLEFEVDNSQEMKKALFTDLQKLSRQNKKMEIDNDALKSQLKVLTDQNNQLMEANQEQSLNFIKLQQLNTDKHLLRIELEESRSLLELMKQEKNMVEIQFIEETRIKDQIIRELQSKQKDLMSRVRMMEGRIAEQDKIINRVANMQEYQQNTEGKELEDYRSLTKTLSGENIRLKEELRRVRSGENINQTPQQNHRASEQEEESQSSHSVDNNHVKNDVMDVSINSQQGSSAKKPQAMSRMAKRQSTASLAQKGLQIIDSMKQSNLNGLSEQTFQELVELAERMAYQLEDLERSNQEMREALEKLSRVAERQRIKLQQSPPNKNSLKPEDEQLFGRVVSELQKEKQANSDLTASIDKLSKQLLKAEREIFKKSEKINYLNMALVNNRQELADASNSEVENLKKYLHNSATGTIQPLDRKTRSHIIDQQDPRNYKGNLDAFARKVVMNESEEEYHQQRSNTSKKMEKKLLAYSTSLVPDLERELEKYKRLYDDSLFALKERDAEAKELQTDLTILKTKYLSLEKGLQQPQRFQAAHRLYDSVISPPTRTVPNSERERPVEPVSQFSSEGRHIKLSQLMKNSSVTHKALLILLQRLSENCLKLARYGSIPILQMDNIYVLDYDPTQLDKLKVRLVDVEMSHRMLNLLRSKSENLKYIAPENIKEGSLITLESLVWNIGAVLEQMLDSKRRESLRQSFDPQLRKQRNTEDLAYEQLLIDLIKNLKAENPSERLSLGRLQYRLQQELSRPPTIEVVPPNNRK